LKRWSVDASLVYGIPHPGDAVLMAPILTVGAGLLIYFGYKLTGASIAALVAALALPRWYWMFQRGREIDFDTPTRSGRPIRARTYLVWGIIAASVSVYGLLAD
jgi:uncharacterized membrane protein YfcA